MTEYVPVSWSKQPVTVDILHQMATNDQALFEMKPTTVMRHAGVTRDRGMKILAGSALFQPSLKWNAHSDVYFGNFFSTGCSPVVQAQHYGYPQMGVSLGVKGLGATQLPDHRGFTAYVWTDDINSVRGKAGTLVRPYYIAYIAVGF